MTAVARESQGARTDRDRYLIVSSDAHAGPSLEDELRPYCPEKHRDAFDEFAHGYREARRTGGANRMNQFAKPPSVAAYENLQRCRGLHDADAFLADMDADGIAAQVIFAGGGNDEPLPWTAGRNGMNAAAGFSAGDPSVDDELRMLGGHIWNAWLADFVAAAPERLLGVMQIPIWDVDAAIEELRWGAEHGLRAINFPAPRPDYAPYNDADTYERFWSAVEDVDLPLVCHSASGTLPPFMGVGSYMIFSSEVLWYSRRALGQMIFGGVFDRHPRLRVGFTEQRTGWVPEHLRDLDSCYLDPNREYPDRPAMLPSDYWRRNCFVGCSFMARYEAEMRDDIGLETLTWGSDYPHIEGTWPNTRLALRKTFAGLPHDDVRTILGDNAVRVYGLDTAILRPVADRVGPWPEELDRPLAPDEEPAHKGLAFRNFGTFA